MGLLGGGVECDPVSPGQFSQRGCYIGDKQKNIKDIVKNNEIHAH